MQAKSILRHFQEVGHWVNWERTCDVFLHGDPDVEVKGIATAWIPTNESIREAAKKGCNLFITHEDAFCLGYAETETGRSLIQDKKRLLDEFGITVLRCHDTWDRMPEHGIPDAWGAFLGFDMEPRPVDCFYRTCLPDSLTVTQTAKAIADKIRPLGQDAVLIFGDRERIVKRLAIGTGAITHLPSMLDLNPDAILATDDGMNYWTGGLWAADLDIPLIIVNHAVAEFPGMQSMARYLKSLYPGLPVEYVHIRYPLASV